jgi:hypothetical protein
MLRTIRNLIFPFSFGLAVSLASPALAEPVEISIGVSLDFASDIVEAMEQHPNACAQDEFVSPEWHRTVWEFFIVCRAVRIGGVDATYSFQNYPNSARAIAEMKKGSFMIMVDLPWGKFTQDENLYRSAAVLEIGDFAKGLYTRPDHAALLNVKTLDELRSFKAVSNEIWFYDWAALERMNVEKFSVPTYVQMGRIVAEGRADFFVDEFPASDDLAQYVEGVRFVPVPGLKLVLPGSRHVAVSKRFPHSQRVFEAVQAGLESLRSRGLIRQGYRDVGFLNPTVEDWAALCCD